MALVPVLHGRTFFRVLSGGLECLFLLPLRVCIVARCTVGRIAHQVSCLIAKIKDGSRIGYSHKVNSEFDAGFLIWPPEGKTVSEPM